MDERKPVKLMCQWAWDELRKEHKARVGFFILTVYNTEADGNAAPMWGVKFERLKLQEIYRNLEDAKKHIEIFASKKISQSYTELQQLRAAFESKTGNVADKPNEPIPNPEVSFNR